MCLSFEASSLGFDMTFPTPSRMLPPTLLRPAPSLCDDLGRRPLSCSSETFLRYSSNFFCCCAMVWADFCSRDIIDVCMYVLMLAEKILQEIFHLVFLLKELFDASLLLSVFGLLTELQVLIHVAVHGALLI